MRCFSCVKLNSLPQPIPAEEHQVDLVISDAQYLPLRKADQPGPDPALDPW
jgi:hypothetical protein